MEFKGIDNLHIDLSARLIYNATSSGNWINHAREFGQVNSMHGAVQSWVRICEVDGCDESRLCLKLKARCNHDFGVTKQIACRHIVYDIAHSDFNDAGFRSDRLPLLRAGSIGRV